MENNELSPSEMCFGLSLELDRRSFSCFLQLAGHREFADLLASRLGEDEIERFIDSFTGLLKKHLSKTEYHQYFLKDHDHHMNLANGD
jgi:hypothetical protein